MGPMVLSEAAAAAGVGMAVTATGSAGASTSTTTWALLASLSFSKILAIAAVVLVLIGLFLIIRACCTQSEGSSKHEGNPEGTPSSARPSTPGESPPSWSSTASPNSVWEKVQNQKGQEEYHHPDGRVFVPGAESQMGIANGELIGCGVLTIPANSPLGQSLGGGGFYTGPVNNGCPANGRPGIDSPYQVLSTMKWEGHAEREGFKGCFFNGALYEGRLEYRHGVTYAGRFQNDRWHGEGHLCIDENQRPKDSIDVLENILIEGCHFPPYLKEYMYRPKDPYVIYRNGLMFVGEFNEAFLPNGKGGFFHVFYEHDEQRARSVEGGDQEWSPEQFDLNVLGALCSDDAEGLDPAALLQKCLKKSN